MAFVKSILGLTLLLASITALGNELGLTASELQMLLNPSPVATEKPIAEVKAIKPGISQSKETLTKPVKKIQIKKAAKAKLSIEKVPKKATKPETTFVSPSFDCQRNYCKYMSSCAEAKYKLEQCGHSKLDRDGDGIPCENICL